MARTVEDVLEDLIKEFQALKYDYHSIRRVTIEDVEGMIEGTRWDKRLILSKLRGMK